MTSQRHQDEDEVKLGNDIDEISFSTEEKLKLINNWKVIRSCLQQFTTDIFLSVFINSEHLFGKIRTPQDQSYDIQQLHSIPMDILKFFEKIILENGLDDVEVLREILQEVFEYYNEKNLDSDLIKILIETIRCHLSITLCRFSSVKVESPFMKLCDLFLKDHNKND